MRKGEYYIIRRLPYDARVANAKCCDGLDM
jgi:hypothetical protein